MEDIIFKLHLLFSLYMFGLIWFVQIVHYPLFAAVMPQNFTAYEQKHTHFTGFVTAPMMVIELLTGIALVYLNLDSLFYWFNLTGIILLWASTFFIQVPLHGQLTEKHQPRAIKKLVQTNWIRTIIWSVRALALVVYL